jgi:hypothetical protein
MNERIRELAEQSLPEFYLTNCPSALEKFAELIVNECNEINKQELAFNAFERLMNRYQEHFTVEEPKGWICPKCGADRTKIACPLGFGATVDGRCPMVVTAQGVQE